MGYAGVSWIGRVGRVIRNLNLGNLGQFTLEIWDSLLWGGESCFFFGD
jgi:hypothetical protein